MPGRFSAQLDESGHDPPNRLLFVPWCMGSRAAVLRRSEPTRFSVGERRQSRRLPGAIRAERAEQSNRETRETHDEWRAT